MEYLRVVLKLFGEYLGATLLTKVGMILLKNLEE